MKLEKLGVKPKDFLLIPNFITYIRFLMIPLLLVFFFLGRTTKNNVYIIGTVICLAISALSDVFDGFAARKLGQVSQLGRMLDPIADKLTLIAVAVCMCFFAPSVIPLKHHIRCDIIYYHRAGYGFLSCQLSAYVYRHHEEPRRRRKVTSIGGIICFAADAESDRLSFS